MGRHGRWAVISSATLLLILLICVFVMARAENRHHALMNVAGAVEGLARRWKMGSLEQLAWEKRRQYFLSSLALQVQRGDLAVIRIPPQRELNPDTFFPELNLFALSNHLSIAFMQASGKSAGITIAIYVRVSDAHAVQEYVERRRAGPAANPDP